MSERWRLIISEPAKKDLRRLGQRDQKAVGEALDRLAQHLGAQVVRLNIKKLHGYPDQRRLRVGSLRVRFTFNVEDHAITILRVLPRGEAYRR